MKIRSTREGLAALRTGTAVTSIWLAALLGLGTAAALLAAPLAGAQEPQELAQAAPAEPDATAPEPPAEPKPTTHSGMEEIVVRGAESQAAGDFEAADSVTGFGAEDLAALGAQDIADLASFTPNLEIVTSGATTPTFFIRGVGLNDFNANSTGAVAIYQDDVAINAPALQLSTLFDIEAVNVLRGPQGTGLARNASAGAIKLYSRKPTGEFGAYLRAELGNYNARDFEGAVEAPIYEDILAGRFAFRLTQRDGTMQNRCANAPPIGGRASLPTGPQLRALDKGIYDPPWSICGENVALNPGRVSLVPTGLERWVNDTDNWAARGTLLFQPTLDMTWLLNAHGARRDELSRLGQNYGTNDFFCLNGDIANCFPGNRLFPDNGSRVDSVLGAPSGETRGYLAPEVRRRWAELAPCYAGFDACQGGRDPAFNAAKIQVAEELANHLDAEPWEGDFNHTGPTTNDTYGGYLKGEIMLPGGIQLTTVTGYDTYDRIIDIDLDFSSVTLFHILTEDTGWQVAQDLRLQGQIGDEARVRWDVGGWFLRENLDVAVRVDLGPLPATRRQYTQDVWSAGGYASLAFDFWEKFTLDGGVRYNWEQKKLDYELDLEEQANLTIPVKLDEIWDAPTGTVRLTYRFREDTHVFWKYTRGWKPGTYNATGSGFLPFASSQPDARVSIAEPETIDSFETGVRGSWLEGRLNLDFSFFYYSYTDYQIFIAQQFEGGNPEFVILNANDAEVYGAEIDAVARPWDGAFVNVRFGWLETQFLDFVLLQQDFGIISGRRATINREIQATGSPLLNSPRFKVSLTAEQTLPLGRFGSITARYDGVWTDTTYYDATEGRGTPNNTGVQFMPENTIAQPPFWVHNLNLTYRPPGSRIEIAGWVRNLTNEAYKTFAFDGSIFRETSIYFVGDPRTFGGTVTVTF
jgi:outer membrane receptor protein involved in Fe transport